MSFDGGVTVSFELRLSRAAAASVRAGHPWVYRESPIKPPVGVVVRLLDERGVKIAWGLADEGPIAIRVLGRGEPAQPTAVIAERVAAAARARSRLVGGDTDAMRVVAGEGDGLPGVVIDRYADVAVVRLYSAAWVPHLDVITAAVRKLGWASVIIRRLGVDRVDGASGATLLFGPELPDVVVVKEHGMRLLVRPVTGQKTGMFLDQREHRRLVRGWSSGVSVVNLFAYHGGFSVAAALGGAVQVSTVDQAPDAIEDARENFRLNGLDPQKHGFFVADAFEWRPERPAALWIVDPPSLSHDRRSDGAARSAYRKLHRALGELIPRDGLLATSSCTARLSLDNWRGAVEEGLSASGDWSWCHVSGEPSDHPVSVGHPEGRYLKFALLRRR